MVKTSKILLLVDDSTDEQLRKKQASKPFKLKLDPTENPVGFRVFHDMSISGVVNTTHVVLVPAVWTTDVMGCLGAYYACGIENGFVARWRSEGVVVRGLGALSPACYPAYRKTSGLTLCGISYKFVAIALGFKASHAPPRRATQECASFQFYASQTRGVRDTHYHSICTQLDVGRVYHRGIKGEPASCAFWWRTAGALVSYIATFHSVVTPQVPRSCPTTSNPDPSSHKG